MKIRLVVQINLFVLFLFILATQGSPAITADVPAPYRTLYGNLQGIISNLDSQIGSLWNNTRYPVKYSNVLMSANSNNAYGILQKGLGPVKEELNGLQSLGITSVSISIGFPVLDKNFYTFIGQSPQLAGQFLDFYIAVAREIHSRGMKLIVEANPMLTVAVESTGKPFDPTAYYQSLPYEQYLALRSAHNILVARQIQPDYLLLQTEPSTDASNVRNPVIRSNLANPTTDLQMISGFVSDLTNANIPGLHTAIKIGTGVGTWQRTWKQYVSGFIRIPGLDVIDTHIYNLDKSLDEINRAMEIADMAHAAGKGVGISEIWLHKSLDASGENIVDIRARNAFSFWSPLDKQFILFMIKFANYKKLEYLNFFESYYFMFAYMDYNSLSHTPIYPAQGNENSVCDRQIETLLMQNVKKALADHQLSDAGMAYKAAIATF